jgi:hypothetical protein
MYAGVSLMQTHCLREVRSQVIRDWRGWHADPNDLLDVYDDNDLYWQMKTETDVETMPLRVNEQLLPHILLHPLAGPVTVHFYDVSDPWDNCKTIQYEVDLTTMSQRKTDSDESQPIRMMAFKILRPLTQ